jgi:hypothetical protein
MPEAELMIGYSSLIFNRWEEVFKTLDTVSRRLVGR